jgi:uncharacterized protein (DUF433 family)
MDGGLSGWKPRERSRFQQSMEHAATHPRIDGEIERDPDICAGDPVLAGTRFPVHNVISYLELCGWDTRRFLADFPSLTAPQVEAAIRYYRVHADEIDRLIAEMHREHEEALAAQRALADR